MFKRVEHPISMTTPLRLVAAATAGLLLTGCGLTDFITGDPQEKEYKTAETLPPLEIPPDLTGLETDQALVVPGRDQPPASASGGVVTRPLNTSPIQGAPIQAAEEPAEPARLTTDLAGGTRLNLAQDFPRAWREVGMALNGEEIQIQDRDRNRGIYYIDYPVMPEKKGGIVSRLKFWGDDEPELRRMLLVVTEVNGQASQVAVFDEDEQLITNAVAVELLEKLRARLN